MNDPWEEFVHRSRDAPCAGYIERGDAPGIPGRWATSFVDPRARFVVTERHGRPGQRDRMTERNQFSSALGRLNRRDARDAQHIPLGRLTGENAGQGIG